MNVVTSTPLPIEGWKRCRATGVTRFQAPALETTRVFFPLSLPGVRSGSLLVFVICLGFYITPAALGGLGDAMLSTFIAAQVQTSFNVARIAAASFVLLAIPVVVLSMLGLDLSGSAPSDQVARESWLPRPPPVGALKGQFGELSMPYRAKRWAAHLYKAGARSAG